MFLTVAFESTAFSRLAAEGLAPSSLVGLNRLHSGRNCSETQRRTGSEVPSDVSAVHIRLQSHLSSEAALLYRARREFSLTGTAALRELLKVNPLRTLGFLRRPWLKFHFEPTA